MSQRSSGDPPSSSSLITWTSNRPIFQTLRTRAWILACFYVTVVLSLPFWIQTTTIERLPLPREEVQQWEAKLPCPIRFRHTLTLRLPIGIVAPENEAEVTRDLARALEAAGDGVWNNVKKVVKQDENDSIKQEEFERPIPLEHAACIDWNVRLNEIGRLEPSSLHYVITIAHNDATESFLSTSTTRHFTINSVYPLHGKPPAEVTWSLASQLSRYLQLPYRDLFFQESHPTIGQASNGALTTENILQRIGTIEMDKRQIPFTRNVRLVFSLINEDVSATGEQSDENQGLKKRKLLSGVAGWNETEAENAFVRRIGPLVEALHGTHRIVTEMQTIWFAPLQFTPNVLEIPRPVSNTKKESDRHKRRRRKIKDASQSNESGGTNPDSQQDVEMDEENDDFFVMEEEVQVPEVIEKDTIYLIRQDDLQVFVNAGEWGLSSSGSEMFDPKEKTESQKGLENDLADLVRQQERTLHFVIYVPKPNHRPLRIAADEHLVNVSAATGWLVPQWGGVSLYNLGYENHELVAKSGDLQEEEIEHGGRMLTAFATDDLDKAFTSFDKQLQSLLGLRKPQGISEEEAAIAMPSSDARLALALDCLVRRRTLGSMRESVRTLASIIRLVEKIKILGVGVEVQNDIKEALNKLRNANELKDDSSAPILRQGSSSPIPAPLSPLRALLDLHYNAELLSSRAFFNPSMLGQLYFPDEHKYAVYTPLFGPLAMPLLVAAIRLFKERRAKLKSKKIAATIAKNEKSL